MSEECLQAKTGQEPLFGTEVRAIAGDAALVVLGCVVRTDDKHPSLLAEGAARRRAVACAAVWQRARAEGNPPAVVIASGGRRWEAGVESDALMRALVGLGVPKEEILRERASFTTKENARFTAALLSRRGIGKVVLCSCAWHLERARALFEAAGLTVTGCVSAGEGEASWLARAWRDGRERMLRALSL